MDNGKTYYWIRVLGTWHATELEFPYSDIGYSPKLGTHRTLRCTGKRRIVEETGRYAAGTYPKTLDTDTCERCREILTLDAMMERLGVN